MFLLAALAAMLAVPVAAQRSRVNYPYPYVQEPPSILIQMLYRPVPMVVFCWLFPGHQACEAE